MQGMKEGEEHQRVRDQDEEREFLLESSMEIIRLVAEREGIMISILTSLGSCCCWFQKKGRGQKSGKRVCEWQFSKDPHHVLLLG